ncbi:MAG: hypothetical protein E6917_01905 [Clostridium botulinum]|nr:hypothetical protein [Clostridium botulinum]
MEFIQNLNVSTYKIQASENEQSKRAAYTLQQKNTIKFWLE